MSLYGAGHAEHRRYVQAAKPQIQSHRTQQAPIRRSREECDCCFQRPMMPQQPTYVDKSVNINLNVGSFFNNCFNKIFGSKEEEGQGAPAEVDPPETPTPAPVENPPEEEETPSEPQELEPTGFSIDTTLLNNRGVTFDLSNLKNDEKAKAQAVVGKVSVAGTDKTQPDTITIVDNTNGENHTFVYEKIADADPSSGKKAQYRLKDVTLDDGTSIKDSHEEVYELDYTAGSTTKGPSYNLLQNKGMAGAGKSSINNFMKYYTQNNKTSS